MGRDKNKFKIGEYVTHKHFGEGKITSIENNKIEIYFPGFDTKTFSLDIVENYLIENEEVGTWNYK